jgi:hypothetical protein
MATITINYDGKDDVMKHLIEAMLAAGAKITTTSDFDSDFYNNKEALQNFQKSIEEEKQGLAREVSLEEIKQMLCL